MEGKLCVISCDCKQSVITIDECSSASQFVQVHFLVSTRARYTFARYKKQMSYSHLTKKQVIGITSEIQLESPKARCYKKKWKVNRASGGKSNTCQIKSSSLQTDFTKARHQQLPPALLPTSFLSLLASLFPPVQSNYIPQVSGHMLNLFLNYLFFDKIEQTKNCQN